MYKIKGIFIYYELMLYYNYNIVIIRLKMKCYNEIKMMMQTTAHNGFKPC